MKKFYEQEQLRFSKKANNANERLNFEGWYDEQIQLFGQEVEYFSYNYTLTGHDPVYGEEPTATFRDAVKVIMLIELNESSLVLSKFGIQSEDDVTGFVSISSYYTLLSTDADPRPEPKAGDVFTLAEYGNDRPGDRGGKSFEITQRMDQEVGTINPLMGHYIWMIQAKRLDYTFQPTLTAEKKSDQVTDSNFSGRLSGYTNPQTSTKIDSTNDIDTESKNIFDYDDIKDGDDIYGDYF